MPIDVESEELITMKQAAELYPSRRVGKRLNVSTIWRWSLHGARGQILETCHVGGQRFTSRQALQRFIDGCSNAPTAHYPNPPKRTAAQRQRDHEKAERELDRMGVK